MNLDNIYATVAKRMSERYPDVTLGGCIYWMDCTLAVLKENGIECLPMAGSAHWMMNKLQFPAPNTFSFVWSPMSAPSQWSVSHGYLPEMHCWVLLRDGNILDCSTGWMKALALEMGRPWDAPPLPPYIHGPTQGRTYLYEPDIKATKLAAALLNRMHKRNESAVAMPKLPVWASQ